VFSKLSNILSKKTKSKIDTDTTDNEIDVSTKKSRSINDLSKSLSSTDMVFGGGVLAIIGVGVFMILGNGTDTSKIEESPKTSTDQHSKISIKPQQPKKPWEYPENTNLKESKTSSDISSENKAPFAEYVKPQVLSSKPVEDNATEELMAPPESYESAYIKKVEGNQTKKPKSLKVKEILVKTKLPYENNISKKQIKEKKNDTFVCRLLEAYSDMKGKEIVYYKKDIHNLSTYIPIYKSNDWDQSGITVEDKFIVTAVDIEHKMVEIAKGQWIPALEFASCTLVEEM